MSKETTTKAANKAEPTPPEVKRHKINRGSSRRIMRAKEAFLEACKAFADEMDRQVYVVDEKGNRTAEAPIVTEVQAFARKANEEVNKLL